MGLAASPWSMKGSYAKATRVRSTLAWPPSGEAVDDAQHGGERSLTTRLDGRILLPADQFRPPLDRRLRHQHALERRSSLDAIQFGSYLVAQRIVKRQVLQAYRLRPSTADIMVSAGIRILRFVRVGVYCRFVNGTASATRAPCEQSP